MKVSYTCTEHLEEKILECAGAIIIVVSENGDVTVAAHDLDLITRMGAINIADKMLASGIDVNIG